MSFKGKFMDRWMDDGLTSDDGKRPIIIAHLELRNSK